MTNMRQSYDAQGTPMTRVATPCELCDDLFDRAYGERRNLCKDCLDRLIYLVSKEREPGCVS